MKIADFGLARSLTNIADNKDSTPILTDYVATRWKVLRTPHSCNSGLISCFAGIEPLRFFWVLQDTHLESIHGQVVVSSENFLEGALQSNQHNFKADNIFQKANFPWHLDHESTWPHNWGEKLGTMLVHMLLKFLDVSTGYGKTRERRHCRRAISIRNHDACISSAPKAKESYRGRRIVGLLCTHCLNHLHCSFFHARVTRLQICCKSSSNSIPRNESRQRKRWDIHT